MSAKRLEIDLVQDHRGRSTRLLTLETVDLKRRRTGPFEGRKARPGGVESPNRHAVMVYVVAYKLALRKPVHPLGLEKKRPKHHGSAAGQLLS